jgi:hypothetical protein
VATLAEGEIIMWYRFSIAATVLMLGGASAAAAELPTYEIMGFPITQHQLAAVNSAHVQERSPSPTLTLGGMPASPHQTAVLMPRSRITEQQVAGKSGVSSAVVPASALIEK